MDTSRILTPAELSPSSTAAFTDSPQLSPRLLLGSLQLLLWLCIHPSAWRNALQQIDPPLRPDASLLSLVRGHWRDRTIRQIIRALLVLPLLISATSGILVWLVDRSPLLSILGSICGFAGGWAGAMAGMMGISGICVSTSFIFVVYADGGSTFWPLLAAALGGLILGGTQCWWRPVAFYPFTAAWNTLLYRADERRSPNLPPYLSWHSVFWDEQQPLPLAWLDEHLVLVIMRWPAAGAAAMERVAIGRQRWAAQEAEIELEARLMEGCNDLRGVATIHERLQSVSLTGPASALLRSLSRASQDSAAALQAANSPYNQRLALIAIGDRLDSLLRELTRSDDRYALRFRPVVTHWRALIQGEIQALDAAAERRQEIPSPYVIGVPLTERQEIFIGRADISARIDVLLRDERHPPILLYGQQRMGKTSLLNNLARLLPSTIVPLFVDLQGPASLASSHAHFLQNLARSAAAAG